MFPAKNLRETAFLLFSKGYPSHFSDKDILDTWSIENYVSYYQWAKKQRAHDRPDADPPRSDESFCKEHRLNRGEFSRFLKMTASPVIACVLRALILGEPQCPPDVKLKDFYRKKLESIDLSKYRTLRNEAGCVKWIVYVDGDQQREFISYLSTRVPYVTNVEFLFYIVYKRNSLVYGTIDRPWIFETYTLGEEKQAADLQLSMQMAEDNVHFDKSVAFAIITQDRFHREVVGRIEQERRIVHVGSNEDARELLSTIFRPTDRLRLSDPSSNDSPTR